MNRLVATLLLLCPATALAQDNPLAAASADDESGAWEEDDGARILGWTRDAHGRPAPIINGDDANVDDFASAGGLVAEGTAFGLTAKLFMCSSTLIAPDVVLTAAHCVDFETLVQQQYGMTLDALDFHFTRADDLTHYQLGFNDPLPEDAVRATSWTWSDDWVGATMIRVGLSANNDIGLLFLEEPIYDVPLAILPTPEEAELIAEGDPVWAVGWGQTTPVQGGAAGTKQMGESFIAELAGPEFKVGHERTDVRKCHGDSGGPSYWDLEESDSIDLQRQIGITSHAYDTTDCNETGGVDTRVDYHLDWINDAMIEACEDGTRSWCPEDDDGEPLEWGILEAPMPQVDDERGGVCGCSSSQAPATGAFWLVGLAMLGLRRRQR